MPISCRVQTDREDGCDYTKRPEVMAAPPVAAEDLSSDATTDHASPSVFTFGRTLGALYSIAAGTSHSSRRTTS
jgi:hypothetical protein